MAVTQYSIRTVKTFYYRGDPIKQFSNRWYFDGGAPADDAAWHALMDAVVLIEKAIYPAEVHIVEAYGYGPTSEVAVASKAYTTAGTLATTGGVICPGDCTVTLRQATTKRSTKNHPVYVFSYFHAALSSNVANGQDTPLAAQVTAVQALGDDWNTGITVGARTYKRTTPDGHEVTGAHVEEWIGHRDFPG